MPDAVRPAVGQDRHEVLVAALDERRRPRAVHVPEQDPHAATAIGGREPLDRAERPSSTRRRPSRHGWPGTGQSRARQPAHGTSTTSSSCGTRHGRQRTAGTVGAKSETTGVPTAAARCAGPVLPTTTRVGAGEHARQLRERRRAAEVESARVAGDARGQRALARPAGDHHRPGVGQRARRAPRSARAATPAQAPTRPGGRRRTRPARRRGPVALYAQATVVAGRQGEAGGRGEVERALDLVHVVVDAVAQVEQRAGVVDRRRADPRDAGEPQEQRGRQRALVERAEDQRAVDAERREPGDERVESRASRPGGSGSIHGARQHEHLVDPGQQLAAWRPRGPQSSVTRSAPAATARIAGPASSTSPSLSSRTARTWVMPRPPQQRASTARARGRARPRGAAATSSRTRARRRHEDRRARRRRRGLDVRADVADHHALAPGRRRARAAARSDQPGRGLAARAAVVRAVRAELERSRADRAAPPPGVDGVDLSCGEQPRAMPLWLETTAIGTPAARSRSSAVARARHGSTRAGSPLYGTSATSVPSRSKSTAAGCAPGVRAARAAGGTPRADSHQRRRPRTGSATLVRSHRRDLARRPRSGRDPRPGELGRAGAATPRRRRRRARRAPAAGERAAASAAAPAAAIASVRAAAAARRRRRARASRGRAARRISASSALPACLAQRDPPAAPGRPGGRRGARPRTIRQPGARHAQAEVGVLAVGAREALVEPADRGERRRAGTPCRRSPTRAARGPRRCAPSRSAGGRRAAAR